MQAWSALKYIRNCYTLNHVGVLVGIGPVAFLTSPLISTCYAPPLVRQVCALAALLIQSITNHAIAIDSMGMVIVIRNHYTWRTSRRKWQTRHCVCSTAPGELVAERHSLCPVEV